MKVDQNVKKGPLSHQKMEMFIFELHSTSDHWPSDPSNESQLKCKKRPPKSLKNEMFVFGLRSTSDDQPSDPSDKCPPKCEKRPPKSSKNEMLVLDYVQLLMISRVI